MVAQVAHSEHPRRSIRAWCIYLLFIKTKTTKCRQRDHTLSIWKYLENMMFPKKKVQRLG